jgi:cobalamin-dependent methionine synthase I
MASAILASENVASINLGIEVPLDQLVRATEKFKPDVVGLTFSAAYQYGAVRANLLELRNRLPETIKIWAGGESILRIRKLPFGIVKIKSLDELPVATLC